MKLLIVLLLFLSPLDKAREKYHKAVQIQNSLKAVEYYRQIIKEAPKTAYSDSSLFRIGMFYYLLGDFEQTINTLEVIYNKGQVSSLYQKACFWLKVSYQNIGDTSKTQEFSKILDTLKMPSNKPITLEGEENKEKTEFYTVQLGAYRDKEWADLFLSHLKEHNVKSYTIQKGEYIRISSGKFLTKEDAEKYLKILQDKGFDGFVILLKP
ncbi:MAG: SPOR domain-containing protein [candidate division WOR-3 bacterium]|nr:SPOR domain-containing protein [candidate division WOR-3 bacterium]